MPEPVDIRRQPESPKHEHSNNIQAKPCDRKNDGGRHIESAERLKRCRRRGRKKRMKSISDSSAPGGWQPRHCSAGSAMTAESLKEYPLLNWTATEAPLTALEVAYRINDSSWSHARFRQSLCRLIVSLEEQGRIQKGSLVPGTEEMKATLAEVREYQSKLRPQQIDATLEEASLLVARHGPWIDSLQNHDAQECPAWRGEYQLNEKEGRCSCVDGLGCDISENQVNPLPNV